MAGVMALAGKAAAAKQLQGAGAGQSSGTAGTSNAVMQAILKAEAERRKQRRKQLFEGSQRGLQTVARSGELLTSGSLGALNQILGNIRSSQKGG